MRRHRCHKREDPKWKVCLEVIQGVLTCLGILAAAWWFLFQAETAGRAVCSHQLSMLKVSNRNTSLWWGVLEIKIENVGHRPLTLKDGTLRVTQIRPLPDDFQLKLDETNDRIHWPLIFSKTKSEEHKIYPYEADYEYFEFTMPANVEAFRVYSYFPVNEKRGWEKISIYEIKDGKIIQVKEPEDLVVSLSSAGMTNAIPPPPTPNK